MESRANYDSKKKSIDFVRWCKCEQKCFKMTAKAQEKCCRKTDGKCVTEGDLFKAFVKNSLKRIDWEKEDVLTENRPYWCVLEDPDKCPTEDSEEVKKRQLRRKAFGLLKVPNGLEKDLTDDFNKEWQDTLPSCVVWSVRLQEKFRANRGLYTGYFPNTEDILELAVTSRDNFQKKMKHTKTIVRNYKLDPKIKELEELEGKESAELKEELIRMGIVNTVATFEAFAYDALLTSFETGFSKTVHCSRDQFDTWIISRIKYDRGNKAKALYSEDNQFWQDFASDSRNPKIERPAFANWIDSQNRRVMYSYYAGKGFPKSSRHVKRVVAVTRTILYDRISTILRSCEPVATSFRRRLSILLDSQPSVFENSNEDFVQRLFEFFMKENLCWNVHLPPAPEENEGPKVEIKSLSFEMLCFVSNLFYGIRCLLVHGNAKRTTEEGRLNMEMEEYEIYVTDGENKFRVKTYLKNLLEKAKTEEMDVDYYLFNTMQSFYEYFVPIVGNTCACVVYFMLCQLRFVDCSRGKAFRLDIPKIREAIKHADNARYESISPDGQAQGGEVVVKGLQRDFQRQDTDIFLKLCEDEFGFKPEVSEASRIGRSAPRKVQPLLVLLKDYQDCMHLLGFAEQLRDSKKRYVRDNVFIEAKKTPAQLRNEFEERESRRQQ